MLPGLAWAVVIFIVISLPPESMPRTPLLQVPNIDKAIHFFMFAVFGALILLGLYKKSKAGSLWLKNIAIAVIAGSAYGILTELIQYCCLPGRHGNVPDVVANVFGTVFGVFIMVMAYRVSIRKDDTKEQKL